MFYGRVDVYWPDGPVESYRLNKATIAVGRSTGNDIVLDTTAISRYHITFTFKDQQVYLEDLDSVNGTYVDGVRLQPHAPYIVRGGEEVQMGEVRLIFHPPLEEVTTPVEDDTTQRIVLSQPTYKLELEGPDIAVAPGAHVKAVLKIQNLGSETDEYTVEVGGLPKGWARTDVSALKLESGEQGQVLISLKPLRRSESKPGEHQFVVRVRSKSQPTEATDAPAILTVLPYSGFGIALGEEQITDNQKFQLYLHNQGNAPLLLTLRGTDANQTLLFQFPPNQLQLGPGERKTVNGTIRLRQRRWFGAEREHEFAVLARAHDPSNFLATIPGSYVEKGMLPNWVPILAAPLVVLVTLLVIAGMIWLLGGSDDKPTVPPTISAFTISHSRVPMGSNINATWEIVDADRVELIRSRVDTEQRYELTPEVSTYDVLFEQTGRYTLTLIAYHDTLTATAEVTVDVVPIITFEARTVEGLELVRNVQQDVYVTWQVQGAQTFDNGYKVWLERADVLTPILPSPLPLSDEYTFPVVITSDQPSWIVTLYAEGQDGVIESKTQEIGVVYPSCELSADSTIVHEGPGESYAAVIPPLENSAEGNLSFSPLARDPSGEWMQVTVSLNNARLGWVKRADFNCTNFDPARLVQTTNFPAPPEPTATPAPTEDAADDTTNDSAGSNEG